MTQKRDFDQWLTTFKSSIASFDYYVDFHKVLDNVERWRSELYLMNSLLGSEHIEADFKALAAKYPDILRVVPILLAVRYEEIPVLDTGVLTIYDFGRDAPTNTPDEYCEFMRSTGLFSLMENHAITNLYDYVTGVEVGLDSNGRKNRGGHLMENLVESYLMGAGLRRRMTGETSSRGRSQKRQSISGDPTETGVYYKELYATQAQDFWGVDLDAITNGGAADKRFDYVARTHRGVFGIETNFYGGGGSKLNETARSYKEIAQEAAGIDGFTFVWVTDGGGWMSARHNLEETFDVLENLYDIADLDAGAFRRLFA